MRKLAQLLPKVRAITQLTNQRFVATFVPMLPAKSSFFSLDSPKARHSSAAIPTDVPLFPYGTSSFRDIQKDRQFFIDKTLFIPVLERSGKYNSIWRPRRFGKTVICNMLACYYDKALSEDERNKIFKTTRIMQEGKTTPKMGQYLVLFLSFSEVAKKGEISIDKSFDGYINRKVFNFSEYYLKAGLLVKPIEIDKSNSLVSLGNLFDAVIRSKQKVYLIVDECDSFINRELLEIDTSTPDIGRGEYLKLVKGRDSLIRAWGNVVKSGTVGAVDRAFFTGVAPVAFADGLSSLNMVNNLTFDDSLSSLFGITDHDVRNALRCIPSLKGDEMKLEEHFNVINTQYNGYRFVPQQSEPMFNPQYVWYYLNSVAKYGRGPRRMIDSAVSGSTDTVANYLIKNYQADKMFASNQHYSLLNLVGLPWKREEASFIKSVDPDLRSDSLFSEALVNDALLDLAFYHGFLTFAQTSNDEEILKSPNQIMQVLFLQALFEKLPEKTWTKIMASLKMGPNSVSHELTNATKELPKGAHSGTVRPLDALNIAVEIVKIELFK